jgi:hypothetical protein
MAGPQSTPHPVLEPGCCDVGSVDVAGHGVMGMAASDSLAQNAHAVCTTHRQITWRAGRGRPARPVRRAAWENAPAAIRAPRPRPAQPPGPADHHQSADRCQWVPADGGGVRERSSRSADLRFGSKRCPVYILDRSTIRTLCPRRSGLRPTAAQVSVQVQDRVDEPLG